MEITPESPSAHYVMGLLHQRMGDESGAVAEWQTALENRSDFAPANLVLAETMLRAGKIGQAEQYVIPVLRQEPASLRALVIFCRVLKARGIYPAANAVAERVEALDAASPQASILRGEIALAEHQTTSALLNYEQAMVLDPSSSEAMQGLIQVYGEGNITRPMLLRMESFAASDRNLSGLMELTGRLFAEHGWTSDAIRCLRRACEMDKERSSAAAEMAKLLARHGQMVSAVDSATRVHEFSSLLAGVKADRDHERAEAVAITRRRCTAGTPAASRPIISPGFMRGRDASSNGLWRWPSMRASWRRKIRRCSIRLGQYTWRDASTPAPSACWNWRGRWPNHEGRGAQACWWRSSIISQRRIGGRDKPSRLPSSEGRARARRRPCGAVFSFRG